MGRFATPTTEQALALQRAIRRQNETRERLAQAESDHEAREAAGAYIDATDAAYEVATQVPRGFACSRGAR